MEKIGIKVLCCLIAGLSIPFLCLSPAFPEEIIINSDQQFDFARSHMKKGEYDRAINEFERFVYFFPKDRRVPLARQLIGICYLKDGRYEDARKVFSRTLLDDPDSPFAGKALFLTGESYYEQGIFAQAGYCFGEVLKTYPSPQLRNAARYRLGWTRMQEGRWREASEDFKRVEGAGGLYDSAQHLSAESLKGETLPYKEPVYAGIMAGIVPGLGHVYVSRYKDAIVAFLLNGLFIWATIESFHQNHNVLGGILAFFEVGWYAGNIYSAVNVTHKWNRKVRDDFRKGLKDRLDLHLLTSEKGPAGLALTFRF
ncbi:MAG: tetratricopeptide repeat protein [Desulfobacteraceae bacterium]|nr:tetratricopeptide repeat protein [Desulfobacteraceae bacterium]